MASSQGTLRKEVLRAYRQIFAVARSWEASETGQTRDERNYMREEARRLFRMNKDLVDEDGIRVCLNEAQSRIELAIHYRNPYPRAINVPPNYVIQSKGKKIQAQRMEQSKPVYIHSQEI
ncbi:hypothetical protein EMCRGX_G028094 [Ephydatia muelleri]|eukprot:Em0020g567a